MAERTLLQKEPNVNRNAKDSVFCDLFGRQEYLKQLYEAFIRRIKRQQKMI